MPRAKAQPNVKPRAAPRRGARAKPTSLEKRPVWQWPDLGMPAKPIEVQEIALDSIWQSPDQRAPNLKRVEFMMQTIKVDGLLQPIIVALKISPKGMRGGRRPHQLLDGGHRVEAFRRLGRKSITARVLNEYASQGEIQRLKVAPNLAREEYSPEQHKEAIRQYHAGLEAADRARYMPGQKGTLALKGGGKPPIKKNQQPHDKNISRVARELGVSRQMVQRAVQAGYLKIRKQPREAIGGATKEAKEYARQHGLAQHKELMSEVSYLPAEKQLAKLKRFVASDEYARYLSDKKYDWRRALLKVWKEGLTEWRLELFQQMAEERAKMESSVASDASG